MCKHALTRLPLISPWAALTSVFWVSDKAVLVLCCFSPTKYWTDLKVAISFFFIFHIDSTQERNLQQLASSLFFTAYISVESVIWSCLWFFGTGYLELCMPCLYRLWSYHHGGSFRGSLPFGWCFYLYWAELGERFEKIYCKLPGSKQSQTHRSPPPLHCFMNSKLFISSWMIWTDQIRQSSVQRGSCIQRSSWLQISAWKHTKDALKTACSSCCHETRQIKMRHLCSKTECGIISCRLGFTRILQDSPSLVFLLPSVWMCIWFPLQILTWLK